VAVALTASWPGVALAGGEPAPNTTTADDSTRFELLDMSRSWLEPGGVSNLTLRVEGAPPGAEVALVAHQVIDSRDALEDALSGEPQQGSVAAQTSLPIETLPGAIEPNTLVVPLGLQDPAAPTDPTRLLLRRPTPGVYPVDVELRDAAGTVLSEFVLPLVVVPPGPGGTPAVGEKLRVAWIWPLVADPARLPDGRFDPDVVAALRPDGRLGRQSGALTAASDIPVTVAPGPETLESWSAVAAEDEALGASLTNARAALATNQVLSGPYVPVDAPSLIGGGLGSQLGAELSRGNATLGTVLGTRVDARTALADPIDGNALSQLRDANIDQLIVSEDSLVPVESQFTPAQPFVLESQGRRATAIASDSGLSAPLTGDAPPALRAQQFLAGLAVVAMEQPNVARGVAVVNPDDWSAPAPLLAAALEGLREHPLLTPVDVDQLLAQVPPETQAGSPLIRVPEPLVPPSPPVSAGAFLLAQGRLSAFQSLVGPDDPRIAAGESALLVSLSSSWTGPGGRERARDQLGAIDTSIDTVLSQIRVPVGSTITLTARKGSVPVTFLNETDQPVRVKVQLESDKLFFPDGAAREVELPPRNKTVVFTVESRASGTFPLELTVTSTDGSLVIQSTKVRVRSTVVSGVGVFLTVGASVFLAGWWLLHFRRGRPKARAAGRRPPDAPVAPATG
jgi:hypothetical protein